GIVVVDADGNALSVNHAWAKVTGQRDGSWRDQGWLDVCDTTDRAVNRHELLAAALVGRSYEADWTSARDGRRRTLHIRAVPDVDDGVLARFLVASADVTDDRARRTRPPHPT